MLGACAFRRNYFNLALKHVIHQHHIEFGSRSVQSARTFSVTSHGLCNMSHSKKNSVNGTGLEGKISDLKMTQNAPAAPDSSIPKSPTSKRPVSPVQTKKSADKPKAMSTNAAPKGPPQSRPLPDDILQRNAFFDELMKKSVEQRKAGPEIKITLAIGPTETINQEGKAYETTPGQMLKHVPKEVAASAIVAKVDGVLWDLDRPLEHDSKVSYLSFEDAEGRDVFWHSSAHMLGEAAEHEYGCKLSHGPPTPMGFFYDMALEPGQTAKESDWSSLESKCKKYVKDKQPYERLEVSKDDLRKMFGYSKYKMHYIEKFVPDGESSTVYRNGTLVDLCQGPHIQNTRKIEAFKIMKNSSAYFLGDQTNDALARIAGVAFPKKEQLKEWQEFLVEAEKRDHKKIGQEQKLFMFSKMSPGSPFLLPHGTRIFNALQDMLREEYWNRGYQEVQTPNMYSVELWKTSGHWQHYQDDMFQVKVKEDAADPMPLADATAVAASGTTKPPVDPKENKDKGVFGLKPMNCPGHCLMFRDEERSYRELPWRIADFGVLHRNEASGALSGLTRVRKFQQDDTHIFCTDAQITAEIGGLFDFMQHVYGLFGFPFKLKFSTRPEGYMGSLADWDSAEAKLKESLHAFRGEDWEMNEGDGAFYGPKIDVTISDALKREYQCATIQLDFQGPQNFKLEYRTGENADGKDATEGKEKDANAAAAGMARPVMIHRAIIGSFERFIAILCEHFAGKWPFWISPRQIMVIPVMRGAEDYVKEIQQIFHKAHMYCDMDLSGNTLQKKIRSAQIAQYNFIFGM
jgi:threonyl-tRNA synthetase